MKARLASADGARYVLAQFDRSPELKPECSRLAAKWRAGVWSAELRSRTGRWVYYSCSPGCQNGNPGLVAETPGILDDRSEGVCDIEVGVKRRELPGGPPSNPQSGH